MKHEDSRDIREQQFGSSGANYYKVIPKVLMNMLEAD